MQISINHNLCVEVLESRWGNEYRTHDKEVMWTFRSFYRELYSIFFH